MNTVPTDHIVWNWNSQTVRVGIDRLGAGPTVLLLPALSSISTRREMRLLQERLASNFTTVAVDWPGFGDEPRPAIRWRPDAYVAFLSYVLTEVVPRPFATVAAGHAGSYALAVGAAAPNSTGRLCLIAPTWRGPLPTMMGAKRKLGEWIARVGDLPVLGQLLYRLNVNSPVGPVPRRVGTFTSTLKTGSRGERLTEKMTVVRATGGTTRIDWLCHRHARPDDEPLRFPRSSAALERAHSRAVRSGNAEKIEGRNAGPSCSPECPLCRAAQRQARRSRGIP